MACCRNAPTVLFIALEIALTGVLARECFFSSRLSEADHGLAFLRPSTLLRTFFGIALSSINDENGMQHLHRAGCNSRQMNILKQFVRGPPYTLMC
jgi:hypothetical protein